MKKKCKKCDTVYAMNDVACPSCGKKRYDVIDESTSSTEARVIGVIVVIVFMIFGLASCSSSDDKNDEDLKLEAKRSACSARTNTYYKCDWSLWEDRCVCKQR